MFENPELADMATEYERCRAERDRASLSAFADADAAYRRITASFYEALVRRREGFLCNGHMYGADRVEGSIHRRPSPVSAQAYGITKRRLPK